MAALEATVNQLRTTLVAEPNFGKLDRIVQRKLRGGPDAIYIPKAELAERAGIKKGYYQAVYRYLSSYKHTDGYALSQLWLMRAGDAETLQMFKVSVEYCLAFLAVSIRDYRSLFPELTLESDMDAERLVQEWSWLVENFEC